MLSSNKNKGPSNDTGDLDGVNAVMLLDRLVSASTAADVIESLQGLERGLSSKKASSSSNSHSSNQELAQSLLVEEDSPDNNKVFTVFWKLLHREHVLVQDDDNAQDGVLWTCRILVQLLSIESERAAKTILQEPSPGRILEALMDVAVADQVDGGGRAGGGGDETDNDNNNLASLSLSPYVRVLACQALHRLCTLQPSLAQTQLLRAPNGLHRLGDLLQVHTDEQVRNQALLLAATLAEWPSVAQVWIFSNLADGLLELATFSDGDNDDGGLTNGPVLVQDCCAILYNLVTHANPNMAAELLLAGGGDGSNNNNNSFGRPMTLLLDLRQGQQFLHPETSNRIMSSTTTISSSSSAGNNNNHTTRTTRDNDEGDDLDDLINSANVGKKDANKLINGGTTADSATDTTTAAAPVPVPRLLASEETILRTILDIWLALLRDQESVQQMAWRQHRTVLRMIWEMALLSPPPTPSTPYPCAIPSIALQQYALHVVAQILAPVSTTEIDRDRLLYLTCTGGLGTTRYEKYQISQAALHVLRRAAPHGIMTTEMIAFALAPPPPPAELEEEDEAGTLSSPPSLPEQALVVPKLLSTIHQNLPAPASPKDDDDDNNDDAANDIDDEQRRKRRDPSVEEMHVVGLVGSTCALSLLLQDDVSRTMLLKLTQKQQEEQLPIDSDGSSFIDHLLQRLDHERTILTQTTTTTTRGDNNVDDDNVDDDDAIDHAREVASCLLRFLATWCTQAPEVVYAVLNSPHATVLSHMYNQDLPSRRSSSRSSLSSTTYNSTTSSPWAIPQLAGLVLGIALAHLQDETQAAGWTRETLMQILTRRQQQLLIKGGNNNSSSTTTTEGEDMDAGLPWSHSSFELLVYRDWKKTTLLSTRQAMVQYLTTTTTTTATNVMIPSTTTLLSTDDAADGEQSQMGNNKESSLPPGGNEGGPAAHAALSQLVAEQTTELQSLRRELDESQSLVASKGTCVEE